MPVCAGTEPGRLIMSVSDTGGDMTNGSAKGAVGGESSLRPDHADISTRQVTAGDRRQQAEVAAAQRVGFVFQPGRGFTSFAVPGGMPQGWLDRIARADMARLANAAKSCADSGTDLIIALNLANPAGIESEVMLHAQLVKDALRSDHIAYSGYLTEPDSDLFLKPRLRLLETVISHATDVIVITEAEPFDRPGPRIVYVNDAITGHTGYRPDQLIGQTPRILQGPLTDAGELARLSAALRRWEKVTATLLNYRSDGSTFWNEISCTPVADEHGWWTHWVAIQRDITERKELSDRLTFLANHDPLTGLANRRLAGGSLDQSLDKAAEEHLSFGVVKVDLDHFKPINDTYGHAAGDAVLSEVALRLKRASGNVDTVARMGGDEFMVIIPRLGCRADLKAATERLLASVNGPFLWNGKRLAISVSMGAALYPEDADTSDGLEIAADAALYEAKTMGRGQSRFISEHQRAEKSEQREVVEDLYDALERNEFEAFLQPKVRLSDRRLIGFEALVRWRHPRKGLLFPPSFLAHADAVGLTRAIDVRVIEQVATLAAQWTKAGLDFGHIAVNISARSFAEPNFVSKLAQALAQANMNPSHLVVEVVESIFINDNAENVNGKFDELRRLGIKIELDDFGTGYAALSHLRAFKVDGIKLDRSFIAGIGTDTNDEILVSAIVGLGNNLGLCCVAEGIETDRQLEFLRGLGCENGQGYLFGRPADGASVTPWLSQLAKTNMVIPIGSCLQG